MNITAKIIITDTNIITDLDNAGILEKFVNLSNVYTSDLIKNDEINFKTGNEKIIDKFKVVSLSIKQLEEVQKIRLSEKTLSTYEVTNFVIAKDNDFVLATGDNRLRQYAIKHNVEVIRTLKIIELMYEKQIITKKEAISACKKLIACVKTRIPIDKIYQLLNELEG